MSAALIVMAAAAAVPALAAPQDQPKDQSAADDPSATYDPSAADTASASGKMDALVKTALAGRADPQGVLDLSAKMEKLPRSSVNKLFEQSIKKFPGYANELRAAWAWQMAVRAQCVRARELLKSADVSDPFWRNSKMNTLEKCSTQ